MGTQAVISLVKYGQTFIKVISGCDGQRAEAVTKEIIQYMLVTDKIEAKDIYDIARELKLGCEDCLVVMDENRIIYKGTEKIRENEYREAFGDPQRNPRWRIGTVECLFIIPVVE